MKKFQRGSKEAWLFGAPLWILVLIPLGILGLVCEYAVLFFEWLDRKLHQTQDGINNFVLDKFFETREEQKRRILTPLIGTWLEPGKVWLCACLARWGHGASRCPKCETARPIIPTRTPFLDDAA